MTTKRKTNRKIKNACREVKEYIKTLISLRHSEYLRLFTALSPISDIHRYVPLDEKEKFLLLNA